MTEPISRRPAPPPAGPQHLLAEFPTYDGAERLVDSLSDKGFPVQHVRIVGNALRLVERVVGRLTNRRAAGAGAASGAWFGLFVGALIGTFSPGANWLGVATAGLVIGAVWGGLFGYLGHAATRGRRDFTSVKSFEADSYAVYVDAEHANEAIRLAGLF